jgi:1,4-alpha-glucan branching enzyme
MSPPPARSPAAADPVELAKLATGRHSDPHRLLGIHPVKGGAVVRAYHPDATLAECVIDGEPDVPMLPLGVPGMFGAFLQGRSLPLRYRLRFRFPAGGVWEQDECVLQRMHGAETSARHGSDTFRWAAHGRD